MPNTDTVQTFAQPIQQGQAAPFTPPPLAALVYRMGKGCRQYAFETADQLSTWAARHPYKNEQLRVHVAHADYQMGPVKTLPASEAAEFVRQHRKGGAA